MWSGVAFRRRLRHALNPQNPEPFQVAFEAHPLREGLTLWNALRCAYLAIFGLYWLYNLAHLFVDLREAAVIAHFTQHRLGLSPRQLSTVTWPEVARRIVDVRGPCPWRMQRMWLRRME